MTEPFSVPVVPGTSNQPYTAPQRRRWLIPALAAVAVLTLAGGVVVFLVLRNQGSATGAGGATSPLAAAWHACGGKGELSDGDKTLYLDMKGKEDTSGVSADEISCVLNQLKTPDFIVREMEQTRAIDGRQSDHWASFEASWTYHPDQGLDLLIREK